MHLTGEKWLQRLLNCIIIFSALQLLLERIFSRVGIFIPKGATTQQMFSMAVRVGFLAGDLLFWALLIFGLLIVWQLWRTAAAGFLTGLLLLALISLVGGSAGGEMVSALLINVLALLVGVMLVFSTAKRGFNLQDNLAALIVSLALVCSLASSILTAIGQELVMAWASNLGSAIFNLGQLLLLGSGLVVFLGLGGTRWRDNSLNQLLALVGATLITGIFLLAFSLDSYTTATLLQWGLGLSLGLPVLLYAISFWCFLMGLARIFLIGKFGNTRAKGLAMLMLAGYQLPFTADLLAAIIGLILLNVPELLHLGTLNEDQSGGDTFVTVQSN